MCALTEKSVQTNYWFVSKLRKQQLSDKKNHAQLLSQPCFSAVRQPVLNNIFQFADGTNVIDCVHVPFILAPQCVCDVRCVLCVFVC